MMAPRGGNDSRAVGHVLVLTDDFGGGTGNHLLQLARRWQQAGVRVEIAAGQERTARERPCVPVHRLRSLGALDVYPLTQAQRLLEIASLVRRLQPDLLHTYFFWPAMYGRAVKSLGLVPHLIENREDLGFSWGAHEYALLRLTRGVPDQIIAVADAVRQTVIAREGIARDRVSVIHNGVPAADPAPPEAVSSLRRELGIREETKVVGLVANLNRRVKGGRFLVEAAKRVLQRSPDVQFVVAGSGDLIPSLRELATEAGVEDAMTFVGYREDIDTFYRMMDVSVLPSLAEGLSITLLESMNHGVPVVATSVGGNPEVVQHGETGFLVPPRDSRALARRIVQLLHQADLRSEMGESARERVRENFDIDLTAQRYLDLYRTAALPS